MKFSNFISLSFGLIETSCLVWACYGFPNIQFAFEKEKVFMAEKCSTKEIACTVENFHLLIKI